MSASGGPARKNAEASSARGDAAAGFARGDAGAGPARGNAEASPAFIGEMCSYAMDVWVTRAGVLTDEVGLLELLRGAAAAGGAQVLGETSTVFDNGAVTAVLLLSQSHLSVHTWPEHQLANFDLLTCGRLNGEHMLDHLKARLRPDRSNVVRVIRDVT